MEELLLILRTFPRDHGLHPFSMPMYELIAKAFQLISDFSSWLILDVC